MQFFFLRPPPFGTGLWAAEISSNKYIYILTFPHIYMSIYIWGYSRGRLPGFNYILYNGPNPPPKGQSSLLRRSEINYIIYKGFIPLDCCAPLKGPRLRKHEALPLPLVVGGISRPAKWRTYKYIYLYIFIRWYARLS